MCMTDDAERVTPINDGEYRVARKQHKCKECSRRIEPGERYHYETFRSDGDFTQHKTCAHCMVLRNWLSAECAGWVYTCVVEDFFEHSGYGRGWRFHRLARNAQESWTIGRTPGTTRLRAIPTAPKTTHESGMKT